MLKWLLCKLDVEFTSNQQATRPQRKSVQFLGDDIQGYPTFSQESGDSLGFAVQLLYNCSQNLSNVFSPLRFESDNSTASQQRRLAMSVSETRPGILADSGTLKLFQFVYLYAPPNPPSTRGWIGWVVDSCLSCIRS